LLEAAEKQLKLSAYLLGDRPCVVDAMILGGLRGHTYVDPVPKRVVSQFKTVVEWVEKRADAWDGSGEIGSFDKPTDFALHILSEMPHSYQPFILGNKEAAEKADKFFVANNYGEEVSYLTRPYPEQSRSMVSAYIKDKLTTEEQALASSWLSKIRLSDSFSN